MERRLSYLIVAVLLRVLDGAVTVYGGTAIWVALQGDLRARGLRVLSESQDARRMRNLMSITPETRGQSDV